MRFDASFVQQLKSDIEHVFENEARRHPGQVFRVDPERLGGIRRVGRFIIGNLMSGEYFKESHPLAPKGTLIDVLANVLIAYSTTREGRIDLRHLFASGIELPGDSRSFLKWVAQMDNQISDDTGHLPLFLSVLIKDAVALKAFSLRIIHRVYGDSEVSRVIEKHPRIEVLESISLSDFSQVPALRQVVVGENNGWNSSLFSNSSELPSKGSDYYYAAGDELSRLCFYPAISDQYPDFFSSSIYAALTSYREALGRKRAALFLIESLTLETWFAGKPETVLTFGLKSLWEETIMPLLLVFPPLRLALSAKFAVNSLGHTLAVAGALCDSVKRQDKTIFFDQEISASDLLQVLRLGIYSREQVAFLGLEAELKRLEIEEDFAF